MTLGARAVLIGLFGLVGSAPAATHGAPSVVPVRSMAAADFVRSVGVNVHMGYTDGHYANVKTVEADLDYLGVHRLRDGAPSGDGGVPDRDHLAAIDRLAGDGAQFDFIVAPPRPLATTLTLLRTIDVRHPGSVFSIEGPNEINNWPIRYDGATGDAAARAFQRALDADVKNDPVLADALVLYFTGGAPAHLDDEDPLADVANAHPYPNHGQVPGARIAAEFATDFPGRPPRTRTITETGYYPNPNGADGNGVDAATAAAGTLDIVADAAYQRIAPVYLYQLLSAYPDAKKRDADTEYGLFRYDNTPTPTAVALHNLLAIVADGAGAATHDDVPTPTVTGLARPGGALLLTKAHGKVDLLLWAEKPFWDPVRHVALAPDPVPTVVDLGAHRGAVAFYDPIAGREPVRRYGEGTMAVTIPVPDHPVILEWSVASLPS